MTVLEISEFVRRHPVLYHIAEPGSWPSIRRHGLLSARALVDLWEVPDAERAALLRRHRPESKPLPHPRLGTAVLRDQKPMRPSDLRPCLLPGIEPEQWYEFLNGMTFLWARPRSLRTMLGAYWFQENDVLMIDTEGLVDRHGPELLLCDQNSGSTRRPDLVKHPGIFQPIANFSGSEIFEVVAQDRIADIAEFVLRVESRKGDLVLRTIWERARP